MSRDGPILVWLRRDLRLADHPALAAAAETGRAVIPVFIRDESVDGLGAAAKFRLGLALEKFSATLAGRGSRLILRSGAPAAALAQLIAETDAGAVFWSRRYDPAGSACDAAVEMTLRDRGIEARRFRGALLVEPERMLTKQGGSYRVFTPFWRRLRDRDPGAPLAAPNHLARPEAWPGSERLEIWQMAAGMQRGAGVVANSCDPGEDAAQDRLEAFVADRLAQYPAGRDVPGAGATSGLSAALSLGEISPRQIWAAGWRALQAGNPGAEAFLRQLAWRDFATYLMLHSPHMLSRNWAEKWDAFPWRTDALAPEVIAWQRGMTGEPFVDAAMREMHVTGRMHNRARMIAASYLTKHLLVHWKIGMDWFAEHLTDWDAAANALGWQWVAGSGPDAAPYFRIFNPATQMQKFDPKGLYRQAWIAEGEAHPSPTALRFFDAAPKSWGVSPGAPYPSALVDLATGRQRALAAFSTLRAR